MNVTTSTRSFLGEPANWKDVHIQLSALQGLWGGWVVLVSGSLEAIVQRISPVTLEKRYKLGLSEAEFRSLLEACLENDLLTIPVPQRPGHPDETMLEITLSNPTGETRTVSKWAGEVLPAFDAVSRQLFALTTRTLNLLPYHTGPFHWPTSPDKP